MPTKKKVNPKPKGRKSEFDPKILPQVIVLCRLGATEEEMAAFFNRAPSTISKWKVDHPDFSEAIKEGKLKSDSEIADALYNRAKGASWVEQQAFKVKVITYDKSGKKVREEEKVQVVDVRRQAPPDTTACIIWLKNRRKLEWRDKIDVGMPDDWSKIINDGDERVNTMRKPEPDDSTDAQIH